MNLTAQKIDPDTGEILAEVTGNSMSVYMVVNKWLREEIVCEVRSTRDADTKDRNLCTIKSDYPVSSEKTPLTPVRRKRMNRPTSDGRPRQDEL